MLHVTVNLPLLDTANRIRYAIERGAFSAELAGSCRDHSPEGYSVLTMVFEKYYMRTSGRASLTVTLSDLSGVTRVWALGAGSADGGLLRLDWGAAEDFEYEVHCALEDNILCDNS